MNFSNITTTGSAAQVGPIQLFSNYPPKLLDFAMACCLVFIAIGVPSNLITIIALLKTKKLRNATAVFIINLTVSDLMFGLFNLPLAASLFGHRAWVHTKFLCQLFPVLRYGLLAVSVFTVLAITINRYVMIAHQRIYRRMYTKTSIAIMVFATWIGAFGALVPTLLEVWGTFGLDPSIGSCTILPDTDGKSPKEFLFVFAFVLPCLAICICYARIFSIVHKAYKKSRNNSGRHSLVYSNCDGKNLSPCSNTSKTAQANDSDLQMQISTYKNSLKKKNSVENKVEKIRIDNLENKYSTRISPEILNDKHGNAHYMNKTESPEMTCSSIPNHKTMTETTIVQDDNSFTDIELSMSSEAAPPATEVITMKVVKERRPSTKSGKPGSISGLRGTMGRRRAASLTVKHQTLGAKDRRLLKMILVIFVSFVACYLPITFIKILGMDDHPIPNTLGLLLIYTTTCINPIIYVVMSSEYRQAYANLLRCSCDGDSPRRSNS